MVYFKSFAWLFLALPLVLFGQAANASKRVWQEINIPGAYCGNGQPYAVFYSPGSEETALAVVLQGGGVCWDGPTCYTRITSDIWKDKKVKEHEGLMSADPAVSSLAKTPILYLPYCTGDIFSGEYVRWYTQQFPVFHFGRHNLKRSFEFLNQQGVLKIPKRERLVLYGYSAGALGLLMNFDWMHSEYFSGIKDKTVILDGTGLHWKSHVWKRFDSAMLGAISRGFSEMGVPFSPDEGMLAQYAPQVCQRYPDYRIGVLQGSMDFVMGMLFGLMNPLTHRRLVYSRQGILQSTFNPDDNCSTWVKDGFLHTFLTDKAATSRNSSRVRAIDYANGLILGIFGSNKAGPNLL